MAIPSEVKKTIEIINAKIESLVQLRDSLMREFGIADAIAGRTPTEDKQLPIPINNAPAVWTAHAHRTTRKKQVIDYIASAGPRSRREIASALGIPEGTVAYVLNDKQTFIPTGNGKWELLPSSKPEHDASSLASNS